ncbi:hypothetical protein FISHEDRAFT_60314 [Fistulina hepatica ATCC 64428]|uniref:Uncharacterized protein n=1 Tax=Fistulina hepatica ATCC 64428 TaxID=1128425 RepID=A0A0D7A736_9AGAR|nr:hypothetical protein FISHEDRAFT_60314 [Fistulina hepatica ATCC 64428]
MDALRWPRANTPVSNLRLYLCNAVLPCILLPNDKRELVTAYVGHKSHQNDLSVQSETWRTLDQVVMFDMDFLKNEIINWLQFFPSAPLKGATEDGLMLQCPEHFPPNVGLQMALSMFEPARNTTIMWTWINGLLMRTATRILSLVYPDETHRYDFTPLLLDPKDDELMHAMLWCTDIDRRRTDPISLDMQKRSVLIVTQCPWILSDTDLALFARAGRFPTGLEALQYNRGHRLWAKIWDLCASNNCRFFVVNNYNSWVFGAFSDGMHGAFVTNVFRFDSQNPSVLTWLTYWLSSAAVLAGSLVIPQVREDEDPWELFPQTVGESTQPSAPQPKPRTNDVSVSVCSGSEWGTSNDSDFDTVTNASGSSGSSSSSSSSSGDSSCTVTDVKTKTPPPGQVQAPQMQNQNQIQADAWVGDPRHPGARKRKVEDWLMSQMIKPRPDTELHSPNAVHSAYAPPEVSLCTSPHFLAVIPEELPADPETLSQNEKDRRAEAFKRRKNERNAHAFPRPYDFEFESSSEGSQDGDGTWEEQQVPQAGPSQAPPVVPMKRKAKNRR